MSRSRLIPLLLLFALIGVLVYLNNHPARAPAMVSQGNVSLPKDNCPAVNANLPAFMPPQACDTLVRILHHGPFPYSQDGAVFGNYEGLLPQQPHGFYHEYTVDTPDAGNRGTRRIITGGTPPAVFYYTGDHYHSFQAFQVYR
ncbi:ribonuclease domain-containing protein [Dyella acidiphila]|uniref:Ribonuclease n=1 Tax=Dyella acidiphila TaxID=2775866 RepID=A0ABR9GF77_9GAMM|nr:ribonuclease domain-containing protein [Dyella acidiphila]MBE1162700.1 ribonuclease [Dyella acidiphila]